MKVFQALYGAVILSLCILTGCHDNRTPQQVEQQKQQEAYDAQLKVESQAKEAQREIDNKTRWLHSCDNNGGVIKIWSGRYDTTLTCANKLESKLSSFQ